MLSNNFFLTQLVPPTTLVLQDEEGMPVHSVLGPVMEGTNLRVSCVASGGELSRLLRLKVNSKLSANQMTLKQR
jgi:hypothetical protein